MYKSDRHACVYFFYLKNDFVCHILSGHLLGSLEYKTSKEIALQIGVVFCTKLHLHLMCLQAPKHPTVKMSAENCLCLDQH